MDEIGDREIFIIYIKQCLHILEGAGILSRKGKHASIRSFVDDDQTLFPRLLHSFWNITPWESIFPSDVEAAKDLQERRSFLKDAILMNPGVSRIDRIANTFFDMTGFSSRGNLFTISFIDFYPLTWLKHFGLLQQSEMFQPGERIKVYERNSEEIAAAAEAGHVEEGVSDAVDSGHAGVHENRVFQKASPLLQILGGFNI